MLGPCIRRSAALMARRAPCAIADVSPASISRCLATVAPAAAAPAEPVVSALTDAELEAQYEAEMEDQMSRNPPITHRQRIPGNIYIPQARYDEKYTIEEANPLAHTYRDVGKYFPLGGGSEEGLKALFPGGLAGELSQEFSVTGTQGMCVRPTGVFLVHALEHWRQVHGRALLKQGTARVLDIDAAEPYSPADVGTPQGVGRPGAPARAERPPMTYSHQPLPTNSSAVGDASVSYTGSDAPVRGSHVSSADLNWNPFSHPLRAYHMLTGPPGIGKSACLNYAVAYARSNRWISVLVPDSFAVMNRGLVLVPSKRREGMVDQHDIALRLLRETLAGQRELLAQVPQRGRYAAFRYLPRAVDVVVSQQRERLRRAEEEERSRLKATADASGKAWDPASFVSKYEDESDTSVDRSTYTLADMAEWGLAHPSMATDALVDLLAELRQVTEFPVLIAVDGHNSLYEPTEYASEGRTLAAEDLSIPAAFHCLGREGFRREFALKRGLYLTTVSQKHKRPMRLFSVADVKQRYRIRVPEATREEIHSQLLHYHKSGNFFMVDERDAVDAFAVEYYRTLCSGRMREISQAAMLQL